MNDVHRISVELKDCERRVRGGVDRTGSSIQMVGRLVSQAQSLLTKGLFNIRSLMLWHKSSEIKLKAFIVYCTPKALQPAAFGLTNSIGRNFIVHPQLHLSI